jgi:hypothetical protein
MVMSVGFDHFEIFGALSGVTPLVTDITISLQRE